jgi:UDP-N-acetylmuramoyl-L-alanyl-D-glutamate--2,6-diaminopimelate ligase
MKLTELIAGAEIRVLHGDRNADISGLAYDSRKTGPGELFFSTAQSDEQGRANVEDALRRGARAAVVRSWDESSARPGITLIECDRPRALIGVAASRFYGAPSRQLDLIGVTGTSGKTTTTYLIESIFAAAGLSCGIIGTIGIFANNRKLYSGLTTPEAIDFESALAGMERTGVRAAAAEISSIGLAEGRVDELHFRAALFTNLGRDHLDYHGTTERYFAAKLRLFSDLLPKSCAPETVAVVNGDDPFGQQVLTAVRGRKVSFGLSAGLDVCAESWSAGIDGIRARVRALGQSFELVSPLLGEINLRNILGASAVSVALGIGTDAVVEGVRRCLGAPGRLEAVAGPADVKVLVDYAHKPDALEAVLTALRALGPRRLICVFGCGGDRDRGKRPIMGAIAGQLADLAILTSDNPRSEDPLAIIAEVEAGLHTSGTAKLKLTNARISHGYLIDSDRRAAIELALKLAGEGDVIVIAGKGHEDYQLVGGRRLDFDDRVVVREITQMINRSGDGAGRARSD